MTADRIKSFISEFQRFVWFPLSALTADGEKAEHFLLPATGNNQLVIAMGRLRITSFASDGCKSIKSFQFLHEEFMHVIARPASYVLSDRTSVAGSVSGNHSRIRAG